MFKRYCYYTLTTILLLKHVFIFAQLTHFDFKVKLLIRGCSQQIYGSLQIQFHFTHNLLIIVLFSINNKTNIYTRFVIMKKRQEFSHQKFTCPNMALCKCCKLMKVLFRKFILVEVLKWHVAQQYESFCNKLVFGNKFFLPADVILFRNQMLWWPPSKTNSYNIVTTCVFLFTVSQGWYSAP